MPFDEQPTPVAKYSLAPTPYVGPSSLEVLRMRQQHLSNGQYHFYKDPVMLVEASMQYCFDEKGKLYLDCYSNVCHVGHCHPYFIRATQTALNSIISNTRYLHPNVGVYAERLKTKLPPSLCVVFMVNSGSEANDLAMRMARTYTKNKTVVCLQQAYHGTTLSCTGVSTSLSVGTKDGAPDFEYAARDVIVAPVPDTYRGEFRATDPDCAHKYAQRLKECVMNSSSSSDKKNKELAAFIHESVQGVGGQIVYPQGYLEETYDFVRSHGGICIADEVQTGFGRSGTHFWAFEAQGVVPDILTLGKPIGNGFPLGAVVCTLEIAKAFERVRYFNTNGGNPVASAAGLAVLDIIDRDMLQENSLLVSRELMRLLTRLKDKYPIIGDVRGVGLFIGIELVRDRCTLEPATEETALVMDRCKTFGVLVGKGGVHNNVIRMKPPLCFSLENATYLVRVLDQILASIKIGDGMKERTNVLTLAPEHCTYNIGGRPPEDDKMLQLQAFERNSGGRRNSTNNNRSIAKRVQDGHGVEKRGRERSRRRRSVEDIVCSDNCSNSSSSDSDHSAPTTSDSEDSDFSSSSVGNNNSAAPRRRRPGHYHQRQHRRTTARSTNNENYKNNNDKDDDEAWSRDPWGTNETKPASSSSIKQPHSSSSSSSSFTRYGRLSENGGYALPN